MDQSLQFFVRERHDLCALLASLSAPQWHAATLDAGWTVEDLVAHIVARERHLAESVWALLAQGRVGLDQDALLVRETARGHGALLASLRTMPPLPFRLPGLVATLNLSEAYIHNEDARRGALQHPRQIGDDLHAALWPGLLLFARRLRRLPVTGSLTLTWPGQDQRVVAVGRSRHAAAPAASATLSGAPGELLLWLTGRKAAALVHLDGTEDLVTALRVAPLGV